MTPNLTTAELLGFLSAADQVEADFSALYSEMSNRPEMLGRFEERLYGWGAYYELGNREHNFVVFQRAGILPQLQRAAEGQNRYATLLSLAADELPDRYELSENQQEVLADTFGLLLSLRYSLRAVGHFGRWMNELVSLAKQGDDESFFRAVSIDPCVMGSPYFQHRLAVAQFRGDREFMKSFQKALKGPTRKISQQHNRIRLAAKMLLDDGSFPKSDADLVDLFCNKLKLYPSTGDPAKALRKLLKVVTPSSTT